MTKNQKMYVNFLETICSGRHAGRHAGMKFQDVQLMMFYSFYDTFHKIEEKTRNPNVNSVSSNDFRKHQMWLEYIEKCEKELE
jgi:hypothetical protein